jgi:hypothetical protein
MLSHTPLLLFLSLFQLTHAQFQPLTIPACSTAYSIISSCFTKFGGVAWATAPLSVAVSCLCYDSSGNYIPNAWDDSASGCTDAIEQQLSTLGNPFGSLEAGLCTNPASVGTAGAGVTGATTGSSGSGASESVMVGSGIMAKREERVLMRW